MTISDIANEIWIELENPNGPTVPFISTWLRNKIGELNTILGKCYSILPVTLEIEPEFGEEEKSIFKKMYFVDYWRDSAKKALSAAGYVGNGTAGIGWVSLREGDSQIVRANPNEVAKIYRGFMQDEQKELNQLINFYKLNIGPSQIAGNDTVEGGNYRIRFNNRNGTI